MTDDQAGGGVNGHREGRDRSDPRGGHWPPGSLLSELTPSTRGELLQLGVVRQYEARRVLLHQGEESTHVVLLLDGCVKVTATTEGGNVTLLDIRVGGDIVGELASLDGQPRSATIVTAGPSVVRLIGQPDFRTFLERRPDAALAVSRAIGAKLRWATRRRVDFGTSEPRVRLARVLAELVESYGEPAGDGDMIATSLTQPELAALVGASEATGQRGVGLTGVFGVGVNCRRDRAEADQYVRDHDVAAEVRRRASLDSQVQELQGQLKTAASDYDAALRRAITAKVTERQRSQGAIGLLERFSALQAMVSRSPFLRVSEWLIRLFFIVIDCLPVIVKLATGNTHYERMVEERLSSEDDAFAEEAKTTTMKRTSHTRVERHEAESEAQLRRDSIDNHRRVQAAQMDAELDAEVEALTRKLQAQFRAKAAASAREGLRNPEHQQGNGQADLRNPG